MKTRQFLLVIALVGLWAVAAYSAVPSASPDVILSGTHDAAPQVADKAFGDPTDFKAAAMAAADYVRRMQSDITEDNAGNGDPDTDMNDAGWDWAPSGFVHSSSASATNLHGVIANSILSVYKLSGDPLLFTTLQDVADYTVSTGPTTFRFANDMIFLLNFADLPGVANPADYRNAALAIWNYKMTVSPASGTGAVFAASLRDSRHGQGLDNGIIAWDVGAYVQAVAMLDVAFPGNGYAADAAAMADVVWEDSFNGNPGYFDFDGVNKGNDPTYADNHFWWYSLGVSGILQAFTSTGTHQADLPLLETRLLECQYADGAFSYQYGATATINDRDWQTSGYALRALTQFLPQTPATNAAAYNGGVWLGASQDASGGFLYADLSHNVEVGSECAMGLAMAYTASAAAVTAATDLNLPNPSACGNTGDISFFYTRSEATPGLFGYELVVSISGGLDPVAITDFTPVAPMDFFRVDNNQDGTFTVNATRYGADPGLLVDGKLFTITVTTSSEVDVDVHVNSYRLRDPQNVPIFADMVGTGFVIDCTAPDAVTGITADPRHNKVDVAWIHDGSDTIAFEVYRGLWYDTTPGVSAYPEYDDLAGNTPPTRPGNYADVTTSTEWVFAGSVAVTGPTAFTDIGTVPSGALTFDPNGADRGIYYYEVFAVDAAGNHSAIAPANDRATNYWLGDVATTNGVLVPDGEVGIPDIDKLGNAFATVDGDASNNYRNYIDVGPTDDWSAKGIPTTDSRIDFEDLMIFALNYSVVGPAKIAVPVAGVVDLAWTEREDGRWALVLVNGQGVQGVHVRANRAVDSVVMGDLVASQGQRPFLTNVGRNLDVNLALLGQGVSFQGSGELFVVDSAADIKATDLSIELRAVDNSRLEYSLDKVNGTNTPMAFSLGANYPNPFNPMTKISFTLPEAQDVTLAVYSLDGRRVATLLNETRGPGQHDVVWMGRDDEGHVAASGIYFYRLDAGPYSQVRKMTLMK